MKKMVRFTAAIILSVCLVMPLGVLAAGTDTVYITASGDKYHTRTCRTIRNSTIYSLTIDEAISRGKTACKVCSPGTGTAAVSAVATQTAPAAAVQTAPAAVTTSAASSLTAEQAVQKAYALYVQNGLDSNSAMTHVQSVLNRLAANPVNYAQIVSEDLQNAAAAAAVSSLTAEQAVQKAYALYVQNGLDSNSAMTHIQSILTQLVSTPDHYAQIVKDDLAKTTSTATAVSTGTSAEQIVQQMYAQLIGQGLTSDQAMAQINAQLPAILAGTAAVSG